MRCEACNGKGYFETRSLWHSNVYDCAKCKGTGVRQGGAGMSVELNRRDLDCAIAEAMGAPVTDQAPIYDAAPCDYWRKDERGWSHLPRFHTSLDALRDGPERLLLAHGMAVHASTDLLRYPKYECEVIDDDDAGRVWYGSSDESEAEARARCALKALSAHSTLADESISERSRPRSGNPNPVPAIGPTEIGGGP